MERWLPVVGSGNRYEVSDTGTVRVRSTWRPMRLSSDVDGYRQLTMVGPDGRRTARVHRLVMEAFVGPCPDGLVVDHINGIRHDNRLENLRYVTQAENIAASTRMGGARVGGGRPSLGRKARTVKTSVSLSPDQAAAIRALAPDATTLAEAVYLCAVMAVREAA